MTTQLLSRHLAAGAFAVSALFACSKQGAKDVPPPSAPESFKVIIGGAEVGHLDVTPNAEGIAIDYDFKNNGRGPTIKEELAVDAAGIPIQWRVSGTTTFGNQVDETFALNAGRAQWTDATGDGEATIAEPTLYISQFASPYADFVYARALLNDPDKTMPALPGGELRLSEMETIDVTGSPGAAKVTTYALTGGDLNPDYFILDEAKRFFAYINPGFITIKSGYEAEESRLRELAAKYSADRYKAIQAKVAHRFGGPVRLRNVRVFDPKTLARSEPVSVVVEGERIARIDPVDVPGGAGETLIDGGGGTLVAGLYEMHGHMDDNDALLNVAAGVTSVRDMGNEDDVLTALIGNINDGTLAGPRITRSGFIEGKSPFSSNNGKLVESEAEALAAIRDYHDKGFYQIKLYNSMNGDWAPALVAEAHRLGMPVMGHVPAFSNANAMIRAGFDEMTHINQVMLGWVLTPEEDTRSLLRLTAMKRFPSIDVNGAKVKETLDLMAQNKTAIDPTLAIHEFLTLSRNGETRIGVADYVDHMPASFQRSAKVALAAIETPEDDAAYRGAYDKIIETVKAMHDRGIFIVFGTDLGGAFNLHREMELYQDVGFTPAEILKRATLDVAVYMGQGADLGSIEAGKYADFLLVPGDPTTTLKDIKTISLVSRGGVIYFPSEIYPEFGITPFTDVPQVTQP